MRQLARVTFAMRDLDRLKCIQAVVDGDLKTLRSTYADFGPTLAAEKLRTKHGIDLAKETVRRLQIAVGLWIPRKLRPPRIQQPRMRRACLGELIQIDGCEHHWFEDAPRWSIDEEVQAVSEHK